MDLCSRISAARAQDKADLVLRGALASSVAHDSHNIIVVGADDEDMLAAVREIEKAGAQTHRQGPR